MTDRKKRPPQQFAKGDARRLFVLLVAIDALERPTLTTLAEYTGHNKGTIPADVEKMREQYGVDIVKDGAVFSIASWGEVLKKAGVRNIIKSP